MAFWRGETDATDLIGGHSGTFYTGTTPTAPSVTPWGKVGSAFAFTGTNYVQIPDAPGLQPPQLTLEAWVFPTVLSSTSYQTVIGRGTPIDTAATVVARRAQRHTPDLIHDKPGGQLCR